MKVSVILPNYNHSAYLKQRIQSILNQTFQDFELIILDDKSPDNSVEIIENYRGHERISHIIINEQNSGSTFRQWDKGFNLAQGDYIWIAESDDYADPTFLEKCVTALDSNEKAVLAFADSHFVDENSNIINYAIEKLVIKEDKQEIVDGAVCHKGVDFLRDYMLRYNFLYNASMILFRQDALKDLSQYYDKFRGCGDWVFWGEMILKHELMHIPQRLNYFRQHSNKVTRKMGCNEDHFSEDACAMTYLTHLYCIYALDSGNSTLEQVTHVKKNRMQQVCCQLHSYLGISKRRDVLSQFKLFNLIPIYSIRYKRDREKHYLFGFIPILSKMLKF